jgi:hypothetical protein
VGQVVRALLPKLVIPKRHIYAPAVRMIGTYRDFRDVVVSYWRVKKQSGRRFDSDKDTPADAPAPKPTSLKDLGQMTAQELTLHVPWVSKQIEILDRYRATRNPDATLWLRYEMFVNNFDWLLDQLATFLHINMPACIRRALYSEFNIAANRRRSHQLSDFDEFDPESMIHGYHVLDGKVGGWTRFVPRELRKRMTEGLRDPLERYGYVDKLPEPVDE